MTDTWLITHPDCLQHDTGPGHPERPDRLRAVLRALDDPEFAALHRVEAEAATPDQLARAHDRAYVEELLAAIPTRGYLALDAGDTVVCPASAEAALRAAGALCQAVDAVMDGAARRVFCAVRPPGHHAEYDQAMGFCLFNNVVVGALHARAAHGVQRIAVIDFDVHHGNGTQHLLGRRDGFFYGSTHQAPLFPGTGRRADNRNGALVNVPLPAGCDSDRFREHFHNEIITALVAFEPELIFISAGFDAHRADPLASLALTEDDFAFATEELSCIANYNGQGRLISTLEGGYDLGALTACTRAHVKALMGDSST
jgi:acetoin utilization deacetylase AcuC-like enzyme